jgi:MFS family permease
MSAAPLAALPIGPVLAVTTSTQVLTTLGALALAAVAPRAAAELGVSPALIGYQVGVVYFGALIAALYGGALVRRLGATRTSQCGLALVAVGCMVSTLGSLSSIALGAWVIGLGYGVTNPAASHLLTRASIKRNMNLVFSLKQTGVPIGGVISGVLLPMLTLAYGWKAALWACALLAAALGLALLPLQRRWDLDRSRASGIFANPLASIVLVWQRPVLRWIAISSFAYSAVQLSLTGFLVTYLVADAALSLVAAGTILSLTHAAGAIGRLAWGWIADRLRSGSAALIANGVLAILGSLATAAIALGWPLWAIASATMLFGFCAIGWNGVFIAVIARQSAPHEVGMATGGTLVFTYAGVMAGPSLFGALHDHAGLSYRASFALLALVTAVGIACVYQARRALPPR